MTDKDWLLYSAIVFGTLFYVINRFGTKKQIGEARFDSEIAKQILDD